MGSSGKRRVHGADYTATQGYECVPYYQCHNGTIITDGGGLIDIRNGFGILSPEDSKCPGFLDVCCLDPDFIPPPPPPIVKHVPKCGQRHENGLGVRIQGFNEYESQFVEWPHMCAVLAEEPVAQDPGYSAQQCQTWMDGELSRLNQEVADMQNAGSLTGRKKAAALAKGLKAQDTLNKYSQCNVFWQPIDAAPLTTGGNGYVDGGDVDISNFERDNYPAAPLTDGTDGYSEP